nr:unnamed protein product [Spirometra erinaceieuropaei]
MICLACRFNDLGGPACSISDIWDHLSELYDLNELNESEGSNSLLCMLVPRGCTMVPILGMESNAKKLGVGVVRDGEVLSNPLLTYVTPPGQGFKPTETARHHQSHVVQVVKRTLDEARVTPEELDATAYTKVGCVC